MGVRLILELFHRIGEITQSKVYFVELLVQNCNFATKSNIRESRDKNALPLVNDSRGVDFQFGDFLFYFIK